MRRKPNSQNRQSNITDAMATPPSSVASRSRPIAIVEMMPISGVVRFAIIAGPAMAKTCEVVTLAERWSGRMSMDFDAPLYLDDYAVLRGGMIEVIQPRQHVVAHVSEDQPFRSDRVKMRLQRLQAEVVPDVLLVGVGLRDEEIGVAAKRHQRLRPFGIGTVGEHAAFRFQPVSQKRPAGFAMYHRIGRHGDGTKAARFLRLEGLQGELELLLCLRRVLEHHLHRL